MIRSQMMFLHAAMAAVATIAGPAAGFRPEFATHGGAGRRPRRAEQSARLRAKRQGR